ncbi:MAG: hypothetical protein U0840_29140 [Gemmataceae bacterium]
MLPRKIVGVTLAALLGLILVPAMAAPSPDGSGAEDDSKWLLGNSEVVFKLNIKQIMGSELLKAFGGVDAIKEAIKSNEQAKAILDSVGLDVTKDVDAIIASGSGTDPKNAKMRLVVRGRFDREKVEAAMKKEAKIKASKEGSINLYEMAANDQTLFAAFANDNTLVVTESKESTVESVKAGGKKAPAVSKEMKAALSKFSGKESMSMVMVVNDDMRQKIAAAPRVGEAASKLQTLTASITVTDNVELAIRGITGDAKAAGQLGKLLEGLKAAAALAGDDVPKAALDIVDALKVASDKDSVKIDLKVTKEMIEKAAKGG